MLIFNLVNSLRQFLFDIWNVHLLILLFSLLVKQIYLQVLLLEFDLVLIEIILQQKMLFFYIF